MRLHAADLADRSYLRYRTGGVVIGNGWTIIFRGRPGHGDAPVPVRPSRAAPARVLRRPCRICRQRVVSNETILSK
jgi:hypothetical protein